MKDLHIHLVQSSIYWEDIVRNLEQFETKINSINTVSNLIVLPEMFSTGFSMRTKDVAESMDGLAIKWMRKISAIKQCVVCGSLMLEENGQYFNRLIWMKPDGTFEQYDKRHLFRMAEEDRYYTPGDERITVSINGWKICPLICYDLRFPVWSRNKLTKDGNYEYDLLLYVANWPNRRSFAWTSLLPARAIENIAYVVGLNRVGSDGFEVDYSGDSAVYNFKGEKLAEGIPSNEGVISCTLNYEALMEFRKAFPAGMDAEEFVIL